MKKILIEYISIIGYVITGLIFGLSCFILVLNFYHNREVAEVFSKGDDYVDAYTKNKEKIQKIKNNISGFDANNYRGSSEQGSLMSIKSKLEMCVSKYEETEANKIFNKKTISIQDDYDLLSYYQSDIINDCVTLQIYSLTDSSNTALSRSLNTIKPFIDLNSKMLMSDLDYTKRVLQNNSSYQFSSDYDKINIFNITRDSYTKIESSYDNSLDLVFGVSEWFKNIIGGGM